mmetsp:Transcript_68334/g.193618  ORF Transcript_68334/g.193618 Transcript_68334/m.193618 type:complete len:329 (-) Transcript_68334:87-1073(-)
MTTKLPNPPPDCISRVRFAPQAGSPNLLVASWDGTTRLYDITTGVLAGHRQPLPVLDCVFIRDASRFLSVGLNKTLVCFDVPRQQEMVLGHHDMPIKCVEFHPQSTQIFTGSWDRRVCAWDPRQGTEPTAVAQVGAKVFCMDAGADRIVVGGSDRCIHIYDLRNLSTRLEKRDSTLKHEVRALKIATDQRAYASGSIEGRCAIEYFDGEENGRLRYAFKCHRVKTEMGESVHSVNAVAYHPVHGTFATGGSDGGVCVWDGYAKKRLWRLDPFHTSVSALDFSADGSLLAMGVSYTFDIGELPQPPPVQLAIRPITDSEVMPKSRAPQD